MFKKNKKFAWPHPTNRKFNTDIRSIESIYLSGDPKDQQIIADLEVYLVSLVERVKKYKVKRESEYYMQTMNLKVFHGYGKTLEDRKKLMDSANVVIFGGNWKESEGCLEDFSYTNSIQKPKYAMYHQEKIPYSDTVRYLAPVRLITDESWDISKQDNVFVYQTADGIFEIIDGNHRHEFAERLGNVEYLKGWIIAHV